MSQPGGSTGKGDTVDLPYFVAVTAPIKRIPPIKD